jgi:hypothetical protein
MVPSPPRTRSEPRDVRPHSQRRTDAHTLAAEIGGIEQVLAREDPIADDALRMVDVIDELIESPGTLPQTSLDATPLCSLNDPRDDIQRPGSVHWSRLLR